MPWPALLLSTYRQGFPAVVILACLAVHLSACLSRVCLPAGGCLHTTPWTMAKCSGENGGDSQSTSQSKGGNVGDPVHMGGYGSSGNKGSG
ncbi:hypothetical protein KC19_6G066800 [Ceratodon purpureus]|uniref:Uncharacterized protein n=1 Tax=Ceratodon purpureus TaxID=3225 RepID=A0A8T0HF75_CERPU|nr:hypothetical protein KC19_6G066800 [Ceratodon purpureus]